jgi:chromosomal replication initiator protein
MITKRIDIFTLLDVISDYFAVSKEQIIAHTRKKEIAYARHMFCYFARNKTRRSLEEIASVINKDHSSVFHGNKKINNLLMYEDVRETVECINYLIGERVGTIEPPKRIQQNGFWYILEEK